MRVMIADDHEIVRAGLAAILSLEDDIEAVATAGTCPDAVRVYFEARPDVVLMDLHMPGGHGAEVIAEIRSADPEARILVLTTYDGDAEVHRALSSGARGYMLKQSSSAELLDALRRVRSGLRVIPPGVAARVAEYLEQEALTAREQDVLQEMVGGATNRRIGERLAISERTVKTHVNRILRKLGARTRTEAVDIATRRGMIQSGRDAH